MRKRVFNRCFSIFGIYLIMVYTCGFTIAPFRWGEALRQKLSQSSEYDDPLLPFIKADKKISEKDFESFIDHLDAGQKAMLWKALTGDIVSGEALETTDIVKKTHWTSSHWITYKFTDFDYHEMTMWTAKKLGVDQEKCESATTFQLEHMICEKLFEKMWDKLTPAQRQEVLKEANLDNKYAAMSGAAVCAAISATLIAGGVASATMGFAFYMLMAKTVVVLATSLGIGSAAGTISAISILCGPIGWLIAGGTAITAAILLGRADVNKCAAAIVQLHVFKVTAMTKSNVDVGQYLKIN